MAKESFWRDVPKLSLKSYWKCTVMHAHMCETEKLEKNNTPNWSVNHWILKTDSFHTVRSFLLILSDKVFHKLHGFYHGGNRWATPVRHNGGRGFSNSRVPVTSKSSQFKQQTLTPCNRSFGWVPFGRFFQFLHDFIFQKKSLSHVPSGYIWHLCRHSCCPTHPCCCHWAWSSWFFLTTASGAPL